MLQYVIFSFQLRETENQSHYIPCHTSRLLSDKHATISQLCLELYNKYTVQWWGFSVWAVNWQSNYTKQCTKPKSVCQLHRDGCATFKSHPRPPMRSPPSVCRSPGHIICERCVQHFGFIKHGERLTKVSIIIIAIKITSSTNHLPSCTSQKWKLKTRKS